MLFIGFDYKNETKTNENLNSFMSWNNFLPKKKLEYIVFVKSL